MNDEERNEGKGGIGLRRDEFERRALAVRLLAPSPNAHSSEQRKSDCGKRNENERAAQAAQHQRRTVRVRSVRGSFVSAHKKACVNASAQLVP